MNKQDILMVGVGGQGIILASDIIAEVALNAGFDVKKTDTLGMAQRGGSVLSHIRIAQKVYAPLIGSGEADILLAFEKLEAARWSTYIRPQGMAIINNLSIPPLSISLGTHKYPDDERIVNIFKQRTTNIYLIKGSQYAKEIGDIRTLNILMLGFLSAMLPIDISDDTWKKHITENLPAKIIDINFLAFNKGREIATSVNI